MEFLICAKDLQPDGTPGCGLAQEAYSFDGSCYGSKNRLTVSQEGSYTVWVKDALGNVREQTVRLLHDKKESSGENSGGGHSDKSGDDGAGKNTGEKGAEDGALKNPDDTAGGPEEAGELKDILEADIFPVADSPFSGKNTGKKAPEKDSSKRIVADDSLGEKSRWKNPDKVPAVLETALWAEAGEQDSGEKEIRTQKPDMDAQTFANTFAGIQKSQKGQATQAVTVTVANQEYSKVTVTGKKNTDAYYCRKQGGYMVVIYTSGRTKNAAALESVVMSMTTAQ